MKKVLGALVSLSLFLSMSGLPLAAEAPAPVSGEPAVKADDTTKKSSTTKKKSSTPKQQPAAQPAGQ